MTREEFRNITIGTRVQYIGPKYFAYDLRLSEGLNGTVCYIDSTSIGVEFDEHINGHSCLNSCKDGYGRFFAVGFSLTAHQSIKSIKVIQERNWKRI